MMLSRITRNLSDLDTDPARELPIAQLRVCNVLREGPRSVSALSRELGTTPSAMTQIADRLQRAGLVERASEEGDRRVRVLRLTTHGEEIMRARREKRVLRITEALSHLDPEMRERIVESFAALLSAGPASQAEPESESSPPVAAVTSEE